MGIEKYIHVISQSGLFRGIPEESYHDALKYLHAFTRSFSKGEFMQISAVTDCVIMFLDFRVLYDSSMKYEYSMRLSVNIIRSISEQNFFMNQKVRILSVKDLRSRIIIYLQSLHPDENGNVTLPFTKTSMAEFLCVNRTALSRELSHMVHDKIIKMKGRKFTLCKQ